MKQTFKSYQAALLAALFFGCIAPGTKFLSLSIPPQTLAGALYFGAGFGLFIILFLKNQFLNSLKEFQRKDRKWLLAATLFGGILGPVFLTHGMLRISGSTGSLLLNLESVLTSLIAWFIFKEHFDKKIVAGIIFIISGCLVLSVNAKVSHGQDTILGFIFISLACLFWSLDNNATRNISHLNPLFTAAIKGLIAGLSNLFLGWMIGEQLNLNWPLIGAGVLGFLGIGVSLVAFIFSLRKIGTARTGAVFSVAPFFGSILAILILKEPVSLTFLGALILMGMGVLCHLSEDHSHEHKHVELVHSHEHVHEDHHRHTHELSNYTEPHTHTHRHEALTHQHPHFPDDHHQHTH